MPLLFVGLTLLILNASTFNVIIVVLHLLLFWMICDLIWFIVKKAGKTDLKRYYAGTVAMVLTVSYLGAGWFFARKIFETEYDFTTEKELGDPLRVVQISDSHLGVTLDGKEFAEMLGRVQSANPDVVVITGDFAVTSGVSGRAIPFKTGTISEYVIIDIK